MNIRSIALLAVFAAAASVLAPSAVHAQANPAPAHPELRPVLDEFGGVDGLTVLMDEFMARLLDDARTREFFEFSDQTRVKQQLVEQFCVILGGDCVYSGRSMAESHQGLDIRRGEFNALVEILQEAMDSRGVPFAAQNKLLAKLAPMHREVVTK
ncbi:group 1 truncated hemoglobin [Aquimonas sp.]|jgi:hemoglobin|uniref:group I truncated hemoglobin n=1 Tax=Aquimonas sp. TaxID=1872588 RepID=UPI0037C185CC